MNNPLSSECVFKPLDAKANGSVLATHFSYKTPLQQGHLTEVFIESPNVKVTGGLTAERGNDGCT